MDSELELECSSLVASDAPLAVVVERLRDFKARGVSRGEVQAFLELMCKNTQNRVLEDRILEIMDFVSGFCRADLAIWDD